MSLEDNIIKNLQDLADVLGGGIKTPPLTTPFLTVNAIVDDILAKMTDPVDRHFIRKMKKKELFKLHHGFGMEVRNEYQLWHRDHPLTAEWHAQINMVIVDGVDHSPTHPDAVSNEIIELLHRKLQYIS